MAFIEGGVFEVEERAECLEEAKSAEERTRIAELARGWVLNGHGVHCLRRLASTTSQDPSIHAQLQALGQGEVAEGPDLDITRLILVTAIGCFLR